MKRLLYILVLSLFSLPGVWSCANYLDMEYIFADELGLDTTFAKKDYADYWLADTYKVFCDGKLIAVASKGNQPFNFLSDDMYYGDRDGSYEWYKNVRYNENTNNPQNNGLMDIWGVCYEGIRKASIYIKYIDKNREMTSSEISDTKAQARFLRGYFYWHLLRVYGPVPLLPDEGMDYTKSYDDLSIPRSTYQECAEYIASEMALAAKDLPLSRGANEIVKPTKGAALSIRARAYLYAASPLFNGNTDSWAKQLVDDTGRSLINEVEDESLWAKAAAAAKDVIDLGRYELNTASVRSTGTGLSYPATIKPPFHPDYSDKNFPDGWADIDPFESYRQIFNSDMAASNNPELIYTHAQAQPGETVQALVCHQYPRSLNGWNTHGVTLKQADAYYMNDGTDYPAYGHPDPATAPRPNANVFTADATESLPLPANVSKEYADREPRFYASIAYNGSIWNVENSPVDKNMRDRQVFYYRGSQDGRLSSSPGFYLRTGIGVKKFVHPRDYLIDSHNYSELTKKADPDIRYAEILLIYAEALNELTQSHTIPNYLGDGSITVSRNTSEMSMAIRRIRVRGGVPDYDASVYSDPDTFSKYLKRERQIELFAETHRYFDLRRWKDAPVEETMPVYGCNMNMTESDRNYFHQPVHISSLPTIFVDKMYLWPINYNELRKNKRLTQNPGWTIYN